MIQYRCQAGKWKRGKIDSRVFVSSSCTTSGTTDSITGGDATVIDGGLIDANLGVVTGIVTAVSLCIEYTIP